MGIILSSTAALALLLQLATQLAAAALLTKLKCCINPWSSFLHCKKNRRFKYSFIDSCVKGRSIAFLSISAQERSNFFDFFLYRYLCIRMISIFFNGFFPGCKIYCQISIDFVTGRGGGGGGRSVFYNIKFNLENVVFVLLLLAQEEGRLQIKRRGFTDLDSTVVMGQSFQFSFLIWGFQPPQRMNTK